MRKQLVGLMRLPLEDITGLLGAGSADPLLVKQAADKLSGRKAGKTGSRTLPQGDAAIC